jgi:hypothetical protein
MRRISGLVAAAVTLALAACGDAGSQDKGSARGSAGTPASGSQSPIPEVLAGTWQTTIGSSRVVDAPADLTQEHSVWRLKFLGTGGEDNGPSMFLSNEQVGEIVHSISLSGDEITLQSDTDCKRFVYVEIGREKLQICSTEQDQGCPSTLISSVLQRPWRLVESGPSRREPTTAEVSLANKEAFVDCARRRDELGIIVGFRDGRAVAEPGQDVGSAEFDTRVSAPRAIAAMLEDGGQYVGVREGKGPDLDVLLLLFETQDDAVEAAPGSMIDEEAGRKAVVAGASGDTARGQFATSLIVSLDKVAPKSRKRTQDALNTCLGRAARAVE